MNRKPITSVSSGGSYGRIESDGTFTGVKAAAKQSTFAGFDFSSVRVMTDRGPALRNVR